MANVNPLIAVVDDEAPVRTMLRRVLRVADFEVAAFASGEEFLASLATHLPRCVILDIHMPGMSGFDVQRRMCAENLRVPFVLITASDEAALDTAAAAAGAICLLRKPFSSDALLAAVRDAVSDETAGT